MPWPLDTDRLLLEPLDEDDIPAFAAYRQDPTVARWQSWDSTYSVADAAELVRSQPESALPDPGGWIQVAIRRRNDRHLLGDIAIRLAEDQPDTYEIGVTLAPSSQGRGIATEAARRILAYLFDEAGAHRVYAGADARNEPVARLFERIGMRHEARHTSADYFKSEWTTLDVFAILDSEHRTPAQQTD